MASMQWVLVISRNILSITTIILLVSCNDPSSDIVCTWQWEDGSTSTYMPDGSIAMGIQMYGQDFSAAGDWNIQDDILRINVNTGLGMSSQMYRIIKITDEEIESELIEHHKI